MVAVLPKVNSNFEVLDIDYVETRSYPTALKPFSLYITSASLLTVPRIYVDDRIVIVGNNVSVFSLLRTLFFENTATHHLVFTNVTVISEDLITVENTSEIADLMFVQESLLTQKSLHELNLNAYCNQVSRSLLKIDRRNKNIVLNDGTVLFYNKLILTAEKEFQITSREQKFNENPKNVFVINSLQDAEQAVQTTLSNLKLRKSFGVVGKSREIKSS